MNDLLKFAIRACGAINTLGGLVLATHGILYANGGNILLGVLCMYVGHTAYCCKNVFDFIFRLLTLNRIHL